MDMHATIEELLKAVWSVPRLTLWLVDPLLGNDCKVSNYTTAIAK
jgi:hypothetical protein